jgi:ribose/xylose/arabinose/galactoside ABC-type transport system permease subunit
LNIGSRQYPFSQRRPPFADGECHLPNSRNRWHRSFHRHDGHTRERDDGCRVQRRLAPPDGSACRPGDWHPGRVLQRFLVDWIRIPDFIVTLGSFSLTSGIALVVSQGIPVQISDQLLRTLSTGSIWLFRLNFLVAVALSVVLHVVLFHMRFGTYVLATGGNLDAARAMGINVARMKFLVYVLCGSLAGVTAVMLIAFIGAAQPAPSTQFLLSAIASVVLGGVSLFGGRATIHGPVVGAIFLTVLYDGLTLLGFSAFYQPIVVGIVVIAAAVLMRRA